MRAKATSLAGTRIGSRQKTWRDYALFIIGHAASPKVRKEMADLLKARYPDVEILALDPPFQRLAPADYNVVLNGPEEWLFVVGASTA
jgi:hypothetical protein